MNTGRLSLSLAIMLSWALSSSAMAQQNLPPGQAMVSDSAAEDGVADLNTRSIFDNSNYMVRGDAGDGVGYIRGFQTVAAFQPITVSPDEFIFWLSPRGIVTYNSGNFGGNLGGGARWLEPNTQRILGLGFWYDHDNNGTNKYDQLGYSFESLGNMFDFRINTYLPVNQNVHVVGQTFTPSSAPFFTGNNIAIGSNSFVSNNALKGGDFEGGGALPGIGDIGIRAYAGGYYYEGPLSGGGIYGVRGRLEALITQNLWGTVIATHDRVFGTNVMAAGTIYLGSGEAPRFFGRIPMTTRLYQQMERQYRVAVQQSVENEVALALRAGGTGGSGGPIGTPIFVDHVDNTAPVGGNGSVEHPFNHLPTTTPGNVDIIFVSRGDGTSNNMNQGITLNNFQRLLGDGVQHQFTALQGTFTLPGFTPGAFPTITNVNANGTAVTLASNNEVSGFNITNASGYGISNFNPNTTLFNPISNFNINNVNVTGSGSGLGTNLDGLHLENATGTGLISASKFDNNAMGSGIVIANLNPPSSTPLALNVTNTEANSNGTSSVNGSSGILISASGAEINPTFKNVTASNNSADGIQINLDPNGLGAGATMTGVFTNVTASNNNNPFVSSIIGSGFDFTSDSSTAKITVTQSTFNTNGLNGINIVLDHPAQSGTNPSNFTGIFDQDTANGNGPTKPAGFGNGFGYLSDNAANGNVTITRSTFDSNTGNGMSFTTLGSSTLTTTLVNNNSTINGNTLDGIFFNLQGTSQLLSATILNDIIENNGGAGIAVLAQDSSVIDSLTIGGYLAQTSVGQNISIPSLNNPVKNPPLILTNGLINREGDTITGNTGAGISIALQDSATSGTINILGNIIQQTKAGTLPGDGINISVSNNAVLGGTTTIDGNTIGSLTNAALGNAGSGIVVTASDSAVVTSLQLGVTGSLIPGNSIGNNGGDGIQITNTDMAVIGNPNPVSIQSNTISANAGNGINITGSNTVGLTSFYEVTNNTVTNNTLNGLFLTNNGSGQSSSLTDTGNTYTGNGQNGMRIDNVATTGQTVTLAASDDTFSTNTLNGLLINNTSTGPSNIVNATVTASTFDSNTQMGIQVQDVASFTNLTVGDATNAALGNTFTANHGAGIFYQTAGTPSPSTTAATVEIFNNTITGTLAGTTPAEPGYGVAMILNGGDTLTNTPRLINLEIGGTPAGTTPGTGAGSNTITGNANDGVHIEVRTLVELPTLNINNNTITGNGGNGINVLATNSLVTDVAIPNGQINNNLVNTNTQNGLQIANSINSVGSWTLSGNQFNTNGIAGMQISTAGNSVLALTSTNDQFKNNVTNGVQLTASDASQMGPISGTTALGAGSFPITLTGDTITGNGTNGVQLTTNDTATLNFMMDSTTVSKNTGDGVNITTNDASLMNVAIGTMGASLNNTIDNNGGNGFNVTTNSSNTFNLLIQNYDISHNTLDGYSALHTGADPVLGAAPVNVTFNNDTITFNGNRGIDVEFSNTVLALASNANLSTYTIGGAPGTGNTISNNAAEGVFLQTDGGVSTDSVFVNEAAYNTGVFNPPPGHTLTDGTTTLNWVDASGNVMNVYNNVLVVATDNVLSSNTTIASPTANMLLNVGTGSVMNADVQRNTFSGNTVDFNTTSFVSAQTPADVITVARSADSSTNTGVPVEQRQIFLDLVAQLNVRFTGNTGTSITPGGGNLLYNADSVKNGVGETQAIAGGNPFGPHTATPDTFNPRQASLFQVENNYTTPVAGFPFTGNALNDFNTFTLTPTPKAAFATGGYDFRNVGTFTPPMPTLTLP
jgi:hypothetical protein